MQHVQLDHSHHVATGSTLPLRLLAHDIESALNVGSLFRIADAFGVDSIVLSGSSPLPPDPKIAKTARATERAVAHVHSADPLQAIARMRDEGWRIVSLELTTASIDVRELPVARGDRICLVLGSENTGVAQSLLDASDAAVHIPMRGRNSSMNVAMACAIAAFHITGRLAR